MVFIVVLQKTHKIKRRREHKQIDQPLLLWEVSFYDWMTPAHLLSLIPLHSHNFSCPALSNCSNSVFISPHRFNDHVPTPTPNPLSSPIPLSPADLARLPNKLRRQQTTNLLLRLTNAFGRLFWVTLRESFLGWALHRRRTMIGQDDSGYITWGLVLHNVITSAT